MEREEDTKGIQLQWFPGHMKKAQRLIEENLKLVDVVVELRDARIPAASANPMLAEIIAGKPRLIALNKSDLTRPADWDWFKAQMDYLQNTYGVDGFKFDAGGPHFYPDDCKYHVPGASGWRQTQQFTLFAAQYPFSELRETCNQPQYAAAERLCDKTHSWTENGLATLIPNSMAQSIMGYQMICPDMIGGGEYSNMTENASRL